MSRDELLRRARRAALAVAGTAGALGGRVRRGRVGAAAAPTRDGSRPRPAPTPGAPPRLGRESTPALPPRIEREPVPELPPRIRRDPISGLPPRIEREPDPPPAAPPPRPDAEGPPARRHAVYRPKHARTDVEQPVSEPRPKPEHTDGGELSPEPADHPGPAPVDAADVPDAVDRAGPPVHRPVPAGAWRPPSTTSTVRGAMRPHMRFVSVIVVVLVVLGGAYFALRVHDRISQSSLERQITHRDRAQDVRCSALQSNGSAWACAVVFRAEAECLIARVNVLGNWSTAARPNRCARIAALEALLPQRITAAGVAADVGQQLGIAGLTCRKVPQHEVRWACGLPPAPGGQCLVVRAVRWQTWPAQAGGRLCDHFPALEAAIRASQGEA